jgi:hypothetical protein
MPSTLRAVTWPGGWLAFFSAIGPVVNFFSPRMGNPGKGEIVWEYVNPFFGGSPNAQTNEIFRAYRYSLEEIARAKTTTRA